jgi:hypothetical protein
MKYLQRWIVALSLTVLPAAPVLSDSLVVVELYTSQGCSSCPPADKLFHKIAARDDVIAVSMHVDYWDYIGWKDEFADPQHAERQRGYALVAERRSVYTPQMIVNGQTDIVGTRPMELMQVIHDYQAKPSLDIELARVGGELTITSEPTDQFEGPFVLYMVRYQPERTARITRGENAGRTFSYANVGQDLTVLGEWDGRTPLDMSVMLDGSLPVVVMAHQGPLGPIVGAERLR